MCVWVVEWVVGVTEQQLAAAATAGSALCQRRLVEVVQVDEVEGAVGPDGRVETEDLVCGRVLCYKQGGRVSYLQLEQ